MAIRTKYNDRFPGRMGFYDPDSQESIFAAFPVKFEDDFLGFKLNKYVAADQSGALWGTVVTSGATAPALVANEPNGVVQVTLDATDETEQQALDWSDQLSLRIAQGLIVEFRAAFHILPTTGTEIARAVMGLASANNATLDSIATNAWFRVESGAQTALLWETDDGNTDDDDNAAGITLVADIYRIFRIDFTTLSAVKFYVDGVLVGTADMSLLTATEPLVQPYFCVQKTKSSANTGIGTIYLDYFRAWMNRS